MPPPKTLGKYQIQEEIGRGGFGVVYRAFDPSVGRTVAIKVLEAVDDQDMLTRFRNEAATGGNLGHPNITTIYDYGEHNGLPFLVMEYLKGKDLLGIIRGGLPMNLDEKVRILIDIARGIHCAHQAGIIHRDIKPANIMVLTDGTVKLMDFGIARLTHGNRSVHTRTGMLVGSVRYMAPEQFEGLEADVRVDIWAWGMIAWELLAGSYPFTGTDPATLMYSITGTDVPSLQIALDNCPELLTSVVGRALKRKLHDRYSAFDDVLFDLQPILSSLRREQCDRLLKQADAAVRQGEAQQAQTLLRQALSLDPGHPDIPAMAAHIRRELDHQTTRKRVDDLLASASQSMAERRFDEAVKALETAQALAPGDGAPGVLLKKATDARTAYQEAMNLAVEARKCMDSSQFSRAFERATEAARIDPNAAEPQSLLKEIEAALRKRQLDQELGDVLEQARRFVALQEFDDAQKLLDGAMQKLGPLPELQNLREEALREKAKQQRQLEIRRLMDRATAELEQGRPEKAVPLLEELGSRFPEARPSATPLLVDAREQVARSEKDRLIGEAVARAAVLNASGSRNEATKLLRAAAERWPVDQRLLDALEQMNAASREDSRRETVDRALAKAEQIFRSAGPEMALPFLDRVLGEFPGEPKLVACRARCVEAIEKSQREKAAQQLQREGAQVVKRAPDLSSEPTRLFSPPPLPAVDSAAPVAISTPSYQEPPSGSHRRLASWQIAAGVAVVVGVSGWALSRMGPSTTESKSASPVATKKTASAVAPPSVSPQPEPAAPAAQATTPPPEATRPVPLPTKKESTVARTTPPLTPADRNPKQTAPAPKLAIQSEVAVKTDSSVPKTAPPKTIATAESKSIPTTATVNSQTAPKMAPCSDRVWGGLSSGRLTWSGQLGKGEVLVIADSNVIAGPGRITGKGPPAQICTEITSIDPPGTRVIVSAFEANPAGRVEVRNDGDAPIFRIELRWRKI